MSERADALAERGSPSATHASGSNSRRSTGCSRSTTHRPRARLSHLETEPLRHATAWLAGYREYWEGSFERLDDLLEAMQREGGSPEGGTAR